MPAGSHFPLHASGITQIPVEERPLFAKHACVSVIAERTNMPTEIFKASRWTKGNLFFPTYIEISDKAVSRRKRSLFRTDEMSMSISKVASVHITTGMVWSEILIESSGGTDPIRSHGHKKEDARRIKDLIENVQSSLARKPAIGE